MGKVHGSLARAGKVKGQTPKVEAQEDKKKLPRGRAKKRLQYNRRYVNVVTGMGGKRVGVSGTRRTLYIYIVARSLSCDSCSNRFLFVFVSAAQLQR